MKSFQVLSVLFGVCFGLAAAWADEPCPNVSGDWACSNESLTSLWGSRTLSWPKELDLKDPNAVIPEGWTIAEKDRNETEVTYVFGVGQYQTTYTATKVQELGLLPTQDIAKTPVAYCDNNGTLLLLSMGNGTVKQGGKIIASNPVISRRELRVNAEHDHLYIVGYFVGGFHAGTVLSRSVCVRKK